MRYPDWFGNDYPLEHMQQIWPMLSRYVGRMLVDNPLPGPIGGLGSIGLGNLVGSPSGDLIGNGSIGGGPPPGVGPGGIRYGGGSYQTMMAERMRNRRRRPSSDGYSSGGAMGGAGEGSNFDGAWQALPGQLPDPSRYKGPDFSRWQAQPEWNIEGPGIQSRGVPISYRQAEGPGVDRWGIDGGLTPEASSYHPAVARLFPGSSPYDFVSQLNEGANYAPYKIPYGIGEDQINRVGYRIPERMSGFPADWSRGPLPVGSNPYGFKYGDEPRSRTAPSGWAEYYYNPHISRLARLGWQEDYDNSFNTWGVEPVATHRSGMSIGSGGGF